MARKDFEEYYNQIKRQYFKIVNMMEEVGEVSGDKMVDPQVIENLQNILTPVKNSYLGLAYVEYLLNLPKDKKTRVRNKKQFEVELSKVDKNYRAEATLAKNNLAIDDAKKLVDEELN